MAPLFTGFRFGFGKSPDTAVASVPFSATGGNVANGLEPGNGWAYHTFTSSGTFVISGAPSGTNIEFLLIGGGGGGGVANNGGSDGGGGGGAGGILHVPECPSTVLGDGTFTVTIGEGGGGEVGGQTPGAAATADGQGENTDFSADAGTGHLRALGGGGGGSGPIGGPLGQYGDGGSGGGGGGGGGAQSTFFGESESVGTQPLIPGVTENEYGFDGGYGSDNAPQGYKGGGGGGAGGAGENYAQGSVGGSAKQYPAFTGPLIGIPTLNPANGYWAAGGSGGSGGPGNFPGIPGRTGLTGSTPDSPGPNAGGAATANTGSGGGAASGNPYPPGPDAPGAGGADGILLIRYQT